MAETRPTAKSAGDATTNAAAFPAAVSSGTSRAPRSGSWRFLLLLLAAPAAYGYQRLAARFPEWVERCYARGFYPAVVGWWSRLTGLLPFSLMELLLALLVLAAPILLLAVIVRTVKAGRGRRLMTFFRPLAMLAVVAALWYAISVPLWNLHYSRPPFTALSGLQTRPADAAILARTFERLTDAANAARQDVTEDAAGIMRLRDDIRTTFARAASGYDALSARFSFLSGQYGDPKPVLLSSLMSYTRIIGLYTVTTAEANIDVDIPDPEIPFTALHEMAHQRGIAREDEANAVAWFASRAHPDADYRYSGALQAWIYASNAMRSADPAAWERIAGRLDDGVRRDLDAQSAYWRQYDSVVDKVAEKANDAWLKSNGQKDGTRSYGRMIDLIIAELESEANPQ